MKVKATLSLAGWALAACAYLEARYQRGRAEALGERLLQECRHPFVRTPSSRSPSDPPVVIWPKEWR